MATKEILIYTDGSCLGNPGPGGWAYIICDPQNGQREQQSGGFAKTTNNRMEILSVIEALQTLTEPCKITLFSDSQYVCYAISKGWLRSWRNKNWIKSDKKPVKNVDLWKRLIPLLENHTLTIKWLRGHTGHRENEQCDTMARACAAKSNLPEDIGFTNNS